MTTLGIYTLAMLAMLPQDAKQAEQQAAQTDDNRPVVSIEMCLLQYQSPQSTRGKILAKIPVIGVLFSEGDQPPLPVTVVSADKLPIRYDGYELRLKGKTLSTLEIDGDAPWTMISAPRILTYVGQEASISVGKAVPYMTLRDDGSLVVEHSDDLVEGVFIDMLPGEADDSSVTMTKAHVKLSRVASRQPLLNVPFDVGLPVIQSRETSCALTLGRDCIAIVRLPTEDPSDAPILMFLSAKLIHKPAAAGG